MISRICEEFTCLPSQAKREDLAECFRIIEYRQYARVKQACDDAEGEDAKLPDSPFVDYVFAFTKEILDARNARYAVQREERLAQEAAEREAQEV